MFGGILDSICNSQITLGQQMGMDGLSAQNVSNMLVTISTSWLGTAPGKNSGGDPDVDRHTLPGDNQDTPFEHASGDPSEPYPYTTAQIEAMINWFATREQGASGDDLKKLQALSSDWSNVGSQMNNLADAQKAPANSMQQGEASALQQDQTGLNGSAGLATGIADFDSIVANIPSFF